ncbi:DNA-binding response regulator [Catellatospora methionotrophica]|uniref:DNA-binding response regulator n=1 Tax=Catellatospora methionotrophica TaxID=121620 RepID=A0A8J3PGA2_9ACTN|nr:response regulator transcription factor [Catellatospora methionotrophica]GIG16561.1 DNA-binding response regulator [Catellatospora methionotrophica]
MNAAALRVVIAEDMVLLRDGLVRLLGSAGMRVLAQVDDARALTAAVAAYRPDLVIVDVRMPPTHTDEGARAALYLHETYPDLGVMVLSQVIEQALATRLLDDPPARFGYLLKDRVLDVDDFLAALRRVADGGTVVDAHIVDRLLGDTGDTRLDVLSTREREVLSGLAQGMSNAAISRRLLVSERTVDAHLRSIFAKLDLHPSADDNRRVRATLTWLAAAS